MSATPNSLERDGEIDLVALGRQVWSRRWWVVIWVVVFAAAFTSAAFLMTPVYRATTVLVPASADRGGMGSLASALGQLGGLAALAGIDIDSGGTQMEESLAVLRSREFTESFIRDRQLMPELFPRKWDQRAGRWKGDEEDWPTLAQASRKFNRRVKAVSQDKKTGLISVRIDWKDPAEAAAWANELVARLNAEMRARAIAHTQASMGYLQKELADTATIETREAINRLMEAQINQRMYANVTEEYALRVVDRALPPDSKDVVSPKKLVLLGLGLGIGLLFGVLWALAADAFSRRRLTRPH